MKGDFTRSTFRPEKHYDGVLMQQGRVQLDADWNEQVEVGRHQLRSTRKDVIGLCGAPKEGGGFALAVTEDGTDLTLSPGRIYVDGKLCEIESSFAAITSLADAEIELEHLVLDGRQLQAGQWLELSAPGVDPVLVPIATVDPATDEIALATPLDAAKLAELQANGDVYARRVVTYTTQPDLPIPADDTQPDITDAPEFDLADGVYLAYLDVWDRHVSGLEDTDIREVALGGPDTTTRIKTTWQVRLERIGDATIDVDCDDVKIQSYLPDDPPPRLMARAEPEDPGATPCVLPADAGYRRLENQLYRLEIHEDGSLGAATFKWSRDNGSVAVAWLGQNDKELTVASPGAEVEDLFSIGQWIEVTDDSHDLARVPGTLTQVADVEGQIVKIADTVDRANFPVNAKLRRWDSIGPLDVERPNANDGWLAIEGGVEVRFEAGHYRSGDYWLVPARTATGDIEWPRDSHDDPVAMPPAGNDHRYCALGLLRVDSMGVLVTDCRPTFPSLIDIRAEDVGFDNDQCAIPEVDTVQEALDFLCEESTLRRHKKHLHGWGIVCGLQVHCGPDDGAERRKVTVREGYAIDAEGNDIVRVDERVDVLTMLDKLEEELGRDVLDEDGNGEICMTLSLDQDGLDHRLGLEPFDPEWNKPQSLLMGTLLMDFYTECIKPIEDFLRNELTGNGDPAGPADERAAILSNLLAQILDEDSGRHIFISKKEHKILSDFYTKLRALLQSKTFCAMFDKARPLPTEPPPQQEMDTIFGKAGHGRIRVRPGDEEAYTVGSGLSPIKPSTKIRRYDLVKKKLVAEIDPIAGTDLSEADADAGVGAVRDVAFSPDGKSIYVIAEARQSDNSLFRSGRIEKDSIKWDPLVTICKLRLVTLATTQSQPGFVFAIAEDAGLYKIDPSATVVEAIAVREFKASGHLEITSDGTAAATMQVQADPPVYDMVLVIDVRTGNQIASVTPPASGVDGIAIVEILPPSLLDRDDPIPRPASDTLYVVSGRDGSGSKNVYAYNLRSGAQVAGPITFADTTIRLEPLVFEGRLLVTVEDEFEVEMIDVSTNQRLPSQVVPAQVAPIAIDTGSTGRNAYILNFGSGTITVAPKEVFDPDTPYDISELADYRKEVLESIIDLTAGFVQYLKDCFCDHFLVDCPDPTGDEKVYLGCVSIREREVYKVCNFSRRRYVKSWPTVGYWVSILPIIPFLDKVVEEFCCFVLPDLFGRYKAKGSGAPASKGRGRYGWLRDGLMRSQGFDLRARISDLVSRTRSGVAVAGEAMMASPTRRPMITGPRIVDQPVERVEESLKDTGATVRREPFDPARAPGPIEIVANAFRTPSPDSEVTLFEKEGRVRYYSVAPGGEELVRKVDRLERSLSEKENEIEGLRARVVTLQETAPSEPATELMRRLEQLESRLESLTGTPAEKKATQRKTTQRKKATPRKKTRRRPNDSGSKG